MSAPTWAITAHDHETESHLGNTANSRKVRAEEGNDLGGHLSDPMVTHTFVSFLLDWDMELFKIPTQYNGINMMQPS